MTRSPLEAKRPLFVRNLLRLYAKASPRARQQGIAWYPEARRIVQEWSASYALPAETVACVIAAISPQCEWPRNLVIADDVLAERAQSVGGALHVNVAKARRIRDIAPTSTDIMLQMFPFGPKVNCFAANLVGSDTLVTVDTHAIQAAFDDVTVTINPKWAPYSIIAECYAHAARKVGIAPAAFQAIIWHAWKEKYPREAKKQERRRW